MYIIGLKKGRSSTRSMFLINSNSTIQVSFAEIMKRLSTQIVIKLTAIKQGIQLDLSRRLKDDDDGVGEE